MPWKLQGEEAVRASGLTYTIRPPRRPDQWPRGPGALAGRPGGPHQRARQPRRRGRGLPSGPGSTGPARDVTLEVVETSQILLPPFVQGHPEAARSLLLADPVRAADLVGQDSGYARSAAGSLHGAVVVDPDLATRLRQNPTLPISLEQDRFYLERRST